MAATATISVAPEQWKEATITGIKLAQTVIDRADGNAEEARRSDPLPRLRDACVRESNNRIHEYARATRAVVVKLQQNLVATNEEIKLLIRARQGLEKSLDNLRKDLALNAETVRLREERPIREKEPADTASDLLAKEREQLLVLKRQLETQLKKVQQQLQTLNYARAQLAAVIQERARVTDLLCHSVGSAYYFARQDKTGSATPTRAHSKTLSAPPVIVHKVGQMKLDVNAAGPVNPLTPAAVEAVLGAENARKLSTEIRQESWMMADNTSRIQQSVHRTVNQGLTQKLAQTVTLAQHLEVNCGEAKLAIQRSQRHHEAQEKALGYLLGPEHSSDITTRERLDRPIVRVYQSHPGTDLPEAVHLVQASGAFLDSLAVTQRNIALLKLARKKIRADLRDKQLAMDIDANAVRLRRRKADHRWVLQGTAMPLKYQHSKN